MCKDQRKNTEKCGKIPSKSTEKCAKIRLKTRKNVCGCPKKPDKTGENGFPDFQPYFPVAQEMGIPPLRALQHGKLHGISRKDFLSPEYFPFPPAVIQWKKQKEKGRNVYAAEV